jgi:1-acyl-sn-glycerol-3-phosphate acyltransferase
VFPPLPGVQVQPVAIQYGSLVDEIAWTGDEGAGANARRILSRKGRIPVRLSFLEPIDPIAAGDRKRLAALAWTEVADRLGRRASEQLADPLYGRR